MHQDPTDGAAPVPHAPGAWRHSPVLAAVPGVVHGFSRAHDGAGVRLDLGTHCTPARWAWVAETLGMPGAPVARLHQIHGRVVHTVDSGGVAGEGDALITRRPGLLLAARMADCVPVLLAGVGVVAAVHAGWRGLAAEVIAATVAALGPGPLVAVVGPCIGRARYEVSEELVDALAATGVDRGGFVSRPAPGARPHADLRAVAAAQLSACGVGTVDVLPDCTWDTPGYWSHRRDGARRGSLAAVIGMVGD